MLLFLGDWFIPVPVTASQSAFNDSSPLIIQADIEEVFGFLRQVLLIIKNTFIWFFLKRITDKLRGILALCTSLGYKEYSELSTRALLWSSASHCQMQEDAFTCPCTGWTFSVPSSLLFLAFLPSFLAFARWFCGIVSPWSPSLGCPWLSRSNPPWAAQCCSPAGARQLLLGQHLLEGQFCPHWGFQLLATKSMCFV